MNEYSSKMESKKQTPTPSVVSRSSRASSHSRVHFNKSRRHKVKASKAVGKQIREQMRKTVAPILQLKKDSDKKLALAKSGYFSDVKDAKIDPKQLQTENDQLMKEIALAVGALRAGLKDKPIRMRLSAPFVITTTITTGVTNTVTINGTNNGLDPSQCTEWTTMAALFEEYKCLGGEAVFNYRNSNSPGTGASMVPNNIPIMAYDADDNTNASSSISLSQTSQHRHYDAMVAVTPGATPSGVAVPACCIKHNFKWHVPKGTDIGNGAAYAGTEWIAVAVTQKAGFLKFYHVGQCITAEDTGAGWIYFDLEFRCRS